jgi:hypothetical protein
MNELISSGCNFLELVVAATNSEVVSKSLLLALNGGLSFTPALLAEERFLS